MAYVSELGGGDHDFVHDLLLAYALAYSTLLMPRYENLRKQATGIQPFLIPLKFGSRFCFVYSFILFCDTLLNSYWNNKVD